MMEEQTGYTSFQSFYTKEEAELLAGRLREHGIESIIIQSRRLLDKTLAGEDLEKRIFLKLKAADFAKANHLMDEWILENIHEVEQDYYLYGFNNQELLEIIREPDTWSRQDFFIAKKILEERKIRIPEETLKASYKFRLSGDVKLETLDKSWLIAGYLFSLFGTLGLFPALAILAARRIQPNGTRTVVYDSSTRSHAWVMLGLSILFLIFGFLFNGKGLIRFFGALNIDGRF